MRMSKLKTGHELVRFEDGQFGIRKYENGKYKYLNVGVGGEAYWWPVNYAHEYGKASKEKVIIAYNKLCDVGRPVGSFDDEDTEPETEPIKKKVSIWQALFGRKT
jgi:hypothetical protein